MPADSDDQQDAQGPNVDEHDVRRVMTGLVAAVRQRVKHDPGFGVAIVRLLGLDPTGRHAAHAAGVRREVSGDSPREATRAGRSFNEFFDAPLVAQRCRLKALAARWQSLRDRLPREVVRPVDEIVLDAGRELSDCYLWMCNATQARQRDEAAMETMARVYETLAEAAELVGPIDIPAIEQVGDDAVPLPSDLPTAEHIQLLAEAQSALHAALGTYRTGGGFDADQMSAYVLAKEFGGRRRVFFRNLAREDRADPSQADDLRQRIAAADDDADEHRDARVAASLAAMQEAVAQAVDEAGDSDADVGSPAFAKLQVALMRLLAEGLETDDPRLVQAAEPLLSVLGEEADATVIGDDLDAVLGAAEATADEEGDVETTDASGVQVSGGKAA